MSKGRLEARITVPSGGWTGTIDDSGGGGAAAWTVAEGEYFLSSLIDAFEDALNLAATTDTITITYGSGEGGTGKVSITSTGNGSLVWTSGDLRDLLGYTATLTLVAATPNVGSYQARSLWIADCSYDAPNEVFPWLGAIETDARSTESPGGALFALTGQYKFILEDLRWHAVARTRASQANESTVNESFERFIRDGVWGFASWGTPGGTIRFYPNADSTNWVEYAVSLPRGFKPDHWADGWAGGPWRCGFDRLVYQDASDDRGTPGAALLTSGSSSVDATSIATSAVTPGSNRAVYAAVLGSSSAGDTTPTATGCGLTWVAEESVLVSASNNRRLTVFRAMGAAPTPGAITFSWGATSQLSFAWSVVECDDVETGGASAALATRQSVTATGTGVVTIAPTLAALEHANNLHLCFVGLSIGTGITPDADFAELSDDGAASAAIRLEAQWAVGQLPCTSTFSSADVGAISLEVVAS